MIIDITKTFLLYMFIHYAIFDTYYANPETGLSLWKYNYDVMVNAWFMCEYIWIVIGYLCLVMVISIVYIFFELTPCN